MEPEITPEMFIAHLEQANKKTLEYLEELRSSGRYTDDEMRLIELFATERIVENHELIERIQGLNNA